MSGQKSLRGSIRRAGVGPKLEVELAVVEARVPEARGGRSARDRTGRARAKPRRRLDREARVAVTGSRRPGIRSGARHRRGRPRRCAPRPRSRRGGGSRRRGPPETAEDSRGGGVGLGRIHGESGGARWNIDAGSRPAPEGDGPRTTGSRSVASADRPGAGAPGAAGGPPQGEEGPGGSPAVAGSFDVIPVGMLGRRVEPRAPPAHAHPVAGSRGREATPGRCARCPPG